MSFWWFLGGALFIIALLLDEAAVWFSRNAVEQGQTEEDPEQALRLARAGRQALIVGRLLLATGVALWVTTAIDDGRTLVLVLAATGLLLFSLARSVYSGLRWRSPFGLAGRAVYRAFSRVAPIFRWLLLFVGRMPGSGPALTAWERVEEMELEREWLLGRRGEEDQRKLLANLREFGESLVEDVMVRREEVAAVPAKAGIPEILELVQQEGHSRYPVYRDTLDTVVGVLHVFDLLTAPAEADAASLARPPHFTNDTKPVGTLLRELQVTYNQMAVVADEYGGIAGIVTVEDLLEEFVGEIEDEHDAEDPQLKRLESGVYWVDGAMRVDQLNEALELDLAEGEYDTVAGLMLERMERIPRVGERLKEENTLLEIVAAEPHRIRAVKVTVPGRNGRNGRSGRHPGKAKDHSSE